MIIQIDTREQKPIDFSFFGVETVHKKLDTGDYSLVGHESKVCIERKFSAGELYINFFAQYDRFKKELLRMTQLQEAYIVTEFPYQDILRWPEGAVNKDYKFTRQHFIDKIEHIKTKYGVKFVFCENRTEAADTIFRILKEFYERKQLDR